MDEPELSLVLSTSGAPFHVAAIETDSRRPLGEQRIRITFGDAVLFISREDARHLVSALQQVESGEEQ
jgi:hypothetical protein